MKKKEIIPFERRAFIDAYREGPLVMPSKKGIPPSELQRENRAKSKLLSVALSVGNPLGLHCYFS